MKQTNVTPFFKDGVHVIGQRTIPVVVPDTESQVFNNQIYSDLTLEVKGSSGSAAFPIKVLGCIDVESTPSYSEILGSNMKTADPVAQIEGTGLYKFSVVGVSHIKVVLAAVCDDITITGKFVE